MENRDTVSRALQTDAERYFERNRDLLVPQGDPVKAALDVINGASPISSVLELGCANGWRLAALREAQECRAVGVDASSAAIEDGSRRFPHVDLRSGLLPEALPREFPDDSFDCVILGFFMYVLPRSDLFRLASEVDRLVSEQGHVVVYDFLYPSPTQAAYAHSSELHTYKMDPSSPWTWSPTYTLVYRDVHQGSRMSHASMPSRWVTVDVLRKNTSGEAYPLVGAPPSAHA